MRILLWHGYLLSGTGSNEYTRALARTLSPQGHDVVVLSQDPRPQDHDLGGATTLRPEVPGHLPVFVLDHYAEAHLRCCRRWSAARWTSSSTPRSRRSGPPGRPTC